MSIFWFFLEGGWPVSDLWLIEYFLTFDGQWIKHAFMARRVNDRGTVSMMICRGKIRASKGAFQIFKADVFCDKIYLKFKIFNFIFTSG